jgi:hypothetical protein
VSVLFTALVSIANHLFRASTPIPALSAGVCPSNA